MRISDWSSDVCSSDLGGDGEAVLQVGADVGNAHLQRRKARRGTHVPPDLGAVLKQAGAHHDVEVALVLAEAVEALRQAGARQLLEHRSEEHTSELQSLMRISYAVFCLKTKTPRQYLHIHHTNT